MSRTTGWAASALVAIALAGCSSSSSGPEALSTFCDRGAAALCARRGACRPQDRQSEARCLEVELAACRPKVAILADAVRARRVSFNAPAAETCLQVLEQGSCTEYSGSCGAIFTAAVAPGGGCDLKLDLLLGESWLTAEQCLHGTCPAACGASCPEVEQVGRPCGVEICEGDAYCSGSTGLCTARLAPGDSCWRRINSCARELFCANGAGLPCQSDLDPACTCRDLLPPGAACGPGPWWAGALPCASGLCLEGVCRRLGSGPGDVCLNTGHCEVGQACITSLTSDEPGTCKALGAEGDACEGARECQRGLVCRTSGRCGAPLPAGGTCAPDSTWLTDCGPWMGCIGGACAAPCREELACPESRLLCLRGCVFEYSEPCATARDCPLGKACQDGRCVASGRPGASCLGAFGFTCTTGICADDGGPDDGTCFDPSSCGWAR